MLWSREQAGQRKGEQEMDISEEFSITRQIHPTRLWSLRARSNFKDHFVSFTLETGKLKPQEGNKDEK